MEDQSDRCIIAGEPFVRKAMRARGSNAADVPEEAAAPSSSRYKPFEDTDVPQAQNWEHQEHPADVIVHSWGMQLADAIESIISGTTGVFTSSVDDIKAGPIRVRDIEGTVDRDEDGRYRMGMGCYGEAGDVDEVVQFHFSGPTLNALIYQILEVGVVQIYGACDYMLIKRGIIKSITYGNSSSDTRSILNDSNLTSTFCPVDDNLMNWGDELTMKGETDPLPGLFHAVIEFYGETFDRYRHDPGTEVKAVTRHCARVVFHETSEELCLLGTDEEAASKWHIYVLVDV